ncbi:hypothetical protein CapIbe_001845 [Capra ibex]
MGAGVGRTRSRRREPGKFEGLGRDRCGIRRVPCPSCRAVCRLLVRGANISPAWEQPGVLPSAQVKVTPVPGAQRPGLSVEERKGEAGVKK